VTPMSQGLLAKKRPQVMRSEAVSEVPLGLEGVKTDNFPNAIGQILAERLSTVKGDTRRWLRPTPERCWRASREAQLDDFDVLTH
jgi:hypothetical protein